MALCVRRAVLDVTLLSGKRFYNFKESNGLEILIWMSALSCSPGAMHKENVAYG